MKNKWTTVDRLEMYYLCNIFTSYYYDGVSRRNILETYNNKFMKDMGFLPEIKDLMEKAKNPSFLKMVIGGYRKKKVGSKYIPQNYGFPNVGVLVFNEEAKDWFNLEDPDIFELLFNYSNGHHQMKLLARKPFYLNLDFLLKIKTEDVLPYGTENKAEEILKQFSSQKISTDTVFEEWLKLFPLEDKYIKEDIIW